MVVSMHTYETLRLTSPDFFVILCSTWKNRRKNPSGR